MVVSTRIPLARSIRSAWSIFAALMEPMGMACAKLYYGMTAVMNCKERDSRPAARVGFVAPLATSAFNQ